MNIEEVLFILQSVGGTEKNNFYTSTNMMRWCSPSLNELRVRPNRTISPTLNVLSVRR